jgi:hypothetical protein
MNCKDDFKLLFRSKSLRYDSNSETIFLDIAKNVVKIMWHFKKLNYNMSIGLIFVLNIK